MKRQHNVTPWVFRFSVCPHSATSKKKTILLPWMPGPFNYLWKVNSICRIRLLLAWSVWNVLFQAQDEWHYLLYSYYCSLPFRQRVYGVMPFIMQDMRLGFYKTHFHLQGVCKAHLWCIFIFIGHLYLYFLLAVSKLARILWVQEALSSWHRCQKVLSNSNVECPVGINLNFFKWTRWKSINKLAVRVFDSWTAWRLYWKITVVAPGGPIRDDVTLACMQMWQMLCLRIFQWDIHRATPRIRNYST